MKFSTMQEVLGWAAERNRAVCAFNVNNMELVQAVVGAADEVGVPVILQVSSGARKYAGMGYIIKLVEAAVEGARVPIALHLDHGDSFELCKECLDAGFSSVMIDGSHLSFEENVAVTKRVVEYARKMGACVEGELGKIAGIEEHVQNDESVYTDPKMAREFVERTGVTSLAVSIGTAHGAFKYKTANPGLRFDILEAIHRGIPGTPLVLHGASSVTPADVETINRHGGRVENAIGVGEDVLAKAIPLGVRKINIDSDLRLAFTAKVREYFTARPEEFDPRAWLGAARAHVRELVKRKFGVFSV